MKKTAILLILIFSLLGIGCGGAPAEPEEYRVLVGEDASVIGKIKNIDLLVIDAAYFSADGIASLKSDNIKKIYSYVNVGSIEDFREYYPDFEPYALGDYENWSEEKWMDVSLPAWREFVFRECAELSEKGVDGFFIDNTDVYYQYPTESIYQGLTGILSQIKSLGKPVILNGGDTFVTAAVASGDGKALFDGVNQECVYTSYDFEDGRCRVSSEEDKAYFTEYLDMLVERDYTVYVLEYATDPAIAKRAYSYAETHKYNCCVSDNIELKAD